MVLHGKTPPSLSGRKAFLGIKLFADGLFVFAFYLPVGRRFCFLRLLQGGLVSGLKSGQGLRFYIRKIDVTGGLHFRGGIFFKRFDLGF